MNRKPIILFLLLNIFISQILGNISEGYKNVNVWDSPNFTKKILVKSMPILADYSPGYNQDEVDTIKWVNEKGSELKPIKNKDAYQNENAWQKALNKNSNTRKSIIERLAPILNSKDWSKTDNNESTAILDYALASYYLQESDFYDNDLDEAENKKQKAFYLAESERFFKQSISKFETYRKAHYNLGILYLKQNQYPNALIAISNAIELGETDGDCYGLLGLCHLMVGNFYSAETSYRQALMMDPNNDKWKIGLAKSLFDSEKYNEAILIFDELILKYPNDSNLWISQSNAFLKKGLEMKAATNLEIVKRLGKADFQSLTLLGNIYSNNRMPDLALISYLDALKITDKKNIDVLIQSAGAFIAASNFEQARTLIKEIRNNFSQKSFNSKSELILLTHEAKIAIFDGNDDFAISLFLEIIKRDLLNGDAIIALGKLYAEQEKLSEAITRFQQAEKIIEYERPALIAHAQCLVNVKKYSEALILLNRALRIEFNDNLKDFTDRVERASRYQ